MKPGVRTFAQSSLKVSISKALPKSMRGRVYEITKVRTEPEYRGRGLASDLMLDTCLDADLAGKFLLVQVDPDDDSPVDRQGLAEFYSKFGFAPIQADPLLMVRPCVGKVCA
jgi:ribosomal protein S18 acetylase RimI-like enzyme